MSARIALSILFTIAMLWLWLPYFFAPKEQIQIVKPITNIPDYIATDLKQTYFSDLGTVSHKVTAEKMSMYQELGFTHFVKPQFTIHYLCGFLWIATAWSVDLQTRRFGENFWRSARMFFCICS